MTLRIAHVLNSPGHGGVPRVAHALVRHLDPHGFANHVFYLKPGDGTDLFEDIDIPRRVASSVSKASAMTELVAWLDAHRIDILHTHSFRPNLYARMAGAVLKPSGLRIVAHYHNEYADKWHGEALVLEQRLAAVTDVAIAVSQAVACHVAAQSDLQPTVLENGVDFGRVTCGDRSAGRASLHLQPVAQVVGLIGRICEQKGVDTFVDAAIRLSTQFPKACFVVVGDAEDKTLAQDLRQRINTAGLSDRITFPGHREDIANTYAALDLLVAPSRWEGFGLVVAEAMAAGVPVIASAVGGIPIVLAGAGRLVPPDDADALSAQIRFVLDDRDTRARMIAEGMAQASRFDWGSSANRLATIYEDLLR